jgi:hypothetical protein
MVHGAAFHVFNLPEQSTVRPLALHQVCFKTSGAVLEVLHQQVLPVD